MRRFNPHILSLSCLLTFFAAGRAEQGDWEDPSWQLLREAHIHRDGASLAAYLRGQCGDDAALGRIDALVRQLGAGDFDEREAAEKALKEAGSAALAQLRTARADADAEVARRAAECVTAIEAKWRPERALAAVRVLVRRGPDEGVSTLLRFLPNADSEELQDEVWFGLDALVVRQGKVDGSLLEALRDAAPERRAAAACIVGRRGDAEQRAAVRKLLDDTEPEVRLRAAQGLLAAKDKVAVPTLTALLEGTPVETAWQAEEMLRYVAGADSPHALIGAGAAADRHACRTAWEAWWKEQGPKVDFAKLDQTSRRPGLMLLCDGGLPEEATGRAWLIGCDGVTRWEMRKLPNPIDARLLGGGQVLIAERGLAPAATIPLAPPPPRKGGSVAAYGADGKALWRYRGIDDPTLCQRLPDGQIVIAGVGLTIAEVNGMGQECFRKDFSDKIPPIAQQSIYSPVTSLLVARELNPASHAYEWRALDRDSPLRHSDYQLGPDGLTCLARRASDVVVNPDASLVLQVNRAPNTGIYIPWLWKQWMPGALHVADLPNGRVLVGGMGRVVEIDGEGRAVWSVSFEDQAQRVGPCLNRLRLGFDAPRVEMDLTANADWLQGLASKDPAVRRRCAYAIIDAGRWATEASFPSLTPLLKDSDEGVREAARRTLNDLKPDVPPEMLKPLMDKDIGVQEDAANHLYLARCRPSRMVEIMIGLMKDENRHTRSIAVSREVECDREQEKVIAALLAAALDDEDADIRQRAGDSVARYGKKARVVIPTLLECLKKDPKKYSWITRTLGALDPMDERVFPVLMEAAQKEGDLAALHGLARCHGRAKEVVPVIIKLLQAEHQDGKLQPLRGGGGIVRLLDGFGPEAKAAVPILVEILRDKSAEMSVRAEAARALGDIGPEAKESISDLEMIKNQGLFQGDVADEALEKIKGD